MEYREVGRVTAKEYLSQAPRLNRRIEALAERQRRYRELGLSCGEDGRRRMAALAWEMEARIGEYARRVRQIERSIDAVEDEVCRDVLKYRYLNGWGWRRIAARMCYSENWVLRLHTRALRAVRVPEGADGRTR